MGFRDARVLAAGFLAAGFLAAGLAAAGFLAAGFATAGFFVALVGADFAGAARRPDEESPSG